MLKEILSNVPIFFVATILAKMKTRCSTIKFNSTIRFSELTLASQKFADDTL